MSDPSPQPDCDRVSPSASPEGEGLDVLLSRTGGVSLRRGVEVLREVALALGALHSRGGVHGALTPRNVLVGKDGRVRIIGLDPASLPDSQGIDLEALRYRPPEQVSGRASTARPAWDFWSVGVMLYEVLTGRPPFEGNDCALVSQQILAATPTRPRQVDPLLPAEAERICLKCLEKDPRLRYATAEGILADLTALLAVKVEQPGDAPASSGPHGSASGVRKSTRFGTVLLRPGLLVRRHIRRAPSFLFAASLLSTVVSVAAGNFLIPEAGGLLAVCLLALSMQHELIGILEENRDVIWVKGDSPRRANLRLAGKFTCLFLGMFGGFAVTTYCMGEGSLMVSFAPQLTRFADARARMSGWDLGRPLELMGHNSLVLVGCFLGSFLFRAGGALLVLGWNASAWGAVYGRLVAVQPSGRARYALCVLLSTTPHIALEAGGYVLGALGGIFISKAIAKYGFDSPIFRKVLWASMGLLLMGLCLVAAAAYVESLATPRIADWLLH